MRKKVIILIGLCLIFFLGLFLFERSLNLNDQEINISEKLKDGKKELLHDGDIYGKSHIYISFNMELARENIERLREEKRYLLDDEIFSIKDKEVPLEEGESVFDVTLRFLRNFNIQVEYSKNEIFNSAYIEGINNIYEFDFGDNSGWVFLVNGEEVNMGSSRYIPHGEDRIEWKYIVD